MRWKFNALTIVEYKTQAHHENHLRFPCSPNPFGEHKGSITKIKLGQDQLFLFKGTPVAVQTGGIIYRHDDGSSTITRLIHNWALDQPVMRSSAQDFDFVIGSVLTKNGLSLTRRPVP